MSTRMAAEIWIGGQIPRKLFGKLCTQIAVSGVALEWGDAPFEPETSADLLEALRDTEGVPLLWLCHEDTRYGQFPELEEFLEKQGIPFDRASEGKYEYDSELVQYRAGMARPRTFITNKALQPVVERSEVRAVLALLNERRTPAALRALKKILSADVPPLTAIEILR